jgi:hypothetical protein
MPVYDVYKQYIDYCASEGMVGISDPTNMEVYRRMIKRVNPAVHVARR